MWISEAATQAGVNAQTIRYYERRGLLPRPPRGTSGYRELPSDTVRLIRFIKRAQDLGFSLDEVSEPATAERQGAQPDQGTLGGGNSAFGRSKARLRN
jgi:DNA-binding transcriptional MerR regulator